MILLGLLLLLLGRPLPVKADWSIQYGTMEGETAWDVAVAPNNDIVVAGTTGGPLYVNASVGGVTDGYVQRRTALGDVIWTRQLGSTDYDDLTAVAVSQAGEAYAAGFSRGSFHGQSVVGGEDMVLVKLSTSGVVLWARQWGSVDNDRALGVAVGPSGAVYVVGRSLHSVDGQTRFGRFDVVVTKWTADGDKVWTRQFGTPENDEGKAIAVSSDEEILVTGFVGDSIDGEPFVGAPGASPDLFVARFAANGDRLWTRLWGDSQQNAGNDIAVSGDVVYVVGQTYSASGTGLFDPFTPDSVSLAYTVNGTRLWFRNFATPVQTDYPTGVGVHASGDIFVSGVVNTQFESAMEMYLARFSTNGHLLWKRVWGASAGDYITGLDIAPSGLIMLSGYTLSSLARPVQGSYDALLTQVKPELNCTQEGSFSGDILKVPGPYEDGVSVCKLCPVGSYANASHRTTCFPCPPGSISLLPGQSACNISLPVVTSINLHTMPDTGGTHVDLRGGNLNISTIPVWRASDGTKRSGVNCSFVTDTRMTCDTPPFPKLGTVSVLIEDERLPDYFDSPTMDVYRDGFVGPSPRSGPIKGGTLVSIAGQGLSSRDGTLAGCRFGTNPASKLVIQPSAIVCTSPMGIPTGRVNVSVSLNGQQWHTVADGRFWFYEASLRGLSINSGLTTGGTHVSMHTEGIVDAGDVPVILMRGNTTGTIVSATQVDMVTPHVDTPLFAPGSTFSVSVQLAPNGQQFLEASFPFALYPPHGLVGAVPFTMPVSSPGMVTLSPDDDKSFSNTGNSIRVRFRSSGGSIVTVSGEYRSSTSIRAAAPTLAPEQSGMGAVSIALNGQQWSPWRELTRFRVDSVAPAWSPSTGDTDVVVTGHGFNSTGINLLCSFDGLQSSGTFVSSSQVRCVTPPSLAPGVVAVGVSTNGANFATSASASIQIYAPPIVSSIEPTKATRGQATKVTISGSGFVDTGLAAVQFGNSDPVRASVLSSTHIVVTTPLDSAGDQPVKVALNGVQFAPSTVLFHFEVITCPSNTISPTGSPQKDDDCVCRPGFYEPNGKRGVECKVCPPEAICDGLGKAPYPRKGYFATTSGFDPVFVRCAVGTACVGGETSGCSPGYTGVLCGICDEGYHRLGDTCEPCQESSAAMLTILVLLFVAYVFYVRRQVRSTRATGRAAALAITNLQVISTFADYRLEWPESVQQFLGLFSLANFNLDIASPECSFASSWTFETRFWFTMALPVIFLVGIVLRVIFQFARAEWVRVRGERFRANHPSFCAEPDASLSGWRFVIELARYRLSTVFTHGELVDQETLRNVVNEMLFTMGLLYITLTTRVLSVFDCTEVQPGVSVLDADTTVQCWVDGGAHAQLLLPAIVFAGVYVLGLPLLLAVIMYAGREASTRHSPAFQQTFSSLFVRFSPQYFWFDAIVLLRKAAIVAIKLFATTQPTLQGLIGLVVIGGAAQLQASWQPYRSSKQNRLESVLLVQSLLILLSGIVFVTGSYGNTDGREAWAGVAIASQIAVLVTCVWFVAKDIWDGVQEERIANLATAEQAVLLQRLHTHILLPYFHPDHHLRLKMLACTKLSLDELRALATEGANAQVQSMRQFDAVQSLHGVTSAVQPQARVDISAHAVAFADAPLNKLLNALAADLTSTTNVLQAFFTRDKSGNHIELNSF